MSPSKFWRDNYLYEGPSKKIPSNDVLALELSHVVQLNGRLLEIDQFEMNESPLTGEPLPIIKELEVLEENVNLTEQLNMVLKARQ